MAPEPRKDEIGTIWQGEDAALAAEAARAVHEARIKKMLSPLGHVLMQRYREYVPDISRTATNVPDIELHDDGQSVVLNDKETETVIEGIELLQRPTRSLLEDLASQRKSLFAGMSTIFSREKRNLRGAMDAKLADAAAAIGRLDSVKGIAKIALEKSKATINKKEL